MLLKLPSRHQLSANSQEMRGAHSLLVFPLFKRFIVQEITLCDVTEGHGLLHVKHVTQHHKNRKGKTKHSAQDCKK